MALSGERPSELVDLAPTLQAVIGNAEGIDSVPQSYRADIRYVISTVAVNAYKAGVNAQTEASPFYREPEHVADRLKFRADLALIRLHTTGSLAARPEVADVITDDVPSYIPFDGPECTPPDGFNQRQKDAQQGLADVLVECFKDCESNGRRKIAAEMSFYYGQHLIAQGVTGTDLERQVRLFENKQNQILEDAVTTGVLRQPDQDDHAFEHYLHDINSATEPVMNEVNSHVDNIVDHATAYPIRFKNN